MVRRRLAEANLLVASALQQAADGRGWFLGALRTSVDFREEQPTYRGEHSLIVTDDTLERITEKVSVPGADVDASPTFSAGGAATLESVRRVHQQTWEFSLRFDRTYRCGDEVLYATSVRLPSRSQAPPMSVMAPQRDCRHFSAVVHLAGLARQAWVLDGVTAPTVSDDLPSGPLIDVTKEPQPFVEFENLTPGLIYGLRWTWSS